MLTLIIDKNVSSVFGPADKVDRNERLRTLAECGFRNVKSKAAEKMLRIGHAAAFLTALLGHAGQHVVWMTDHDEIAANQGRYDQLLRLFQNVLGLYSNKQFDRGSGAFPFAERDTGHLDLLSATDICAGTLAQYFADRGGVGELGASQRGCGTGFDVAWERWICFEKNSV